MSESGVLIVGAGLTGLTAAHHLQEAGVDAVVVDKGRTPGGRMATRRVGEARFDHGAQHFSVRSPEFRSQVDGWATHGLVREWLSSASIAEPARGVEPRYVGTEGMRRITESMADGLDVRTSVTVDRLDVVNDTVTAVMGEDVVAVAAAAILSPPVPQTLALLESSEIALPDRL